MRFSLFQKPLFFSFLILLAYSVFFLNMTGCGSGSVFQESSKTPPPGNIECTPGATQSCYTGPEGTMGIGICAGGTQTCLADGSGFGACQAEILPKTEDCSTKDVDEDCNGVKLCSGDTVWAAAFKDIGSIQNITAVTHDSQDNVLVTGIFSKSITFGQTTLNVTAHDHDTLFVAKLDSNGNLSWMKKFESEHVTGGSSTVFARNISTDNSGNIIVSGGFNTSGGDKLGFGGTSFQSKGNKDFFIFKLNPKGETLWSKQFGVCVDPEDSGFCDDNALFISTDTQGSLILTGYFGGMLNLGGLNLVSSGNGHLNFIGKLDGQGNHLWSRPLDPDHYFQIQKIYSDSSYNLYLAGNFQNSITLGNGSNLTSSGGQDVFAAKLDKDGNAIWSHSYGNSAQQSVTAFSIDSSGNSLLVGSLAGAIDFGKGPLSAATTGNTAFMAKLDSSGNAVWSKTLTSIGYLRPNQIQSDESGNLFLGGYFSGAIDLGSGPLVSTGNNDLFLAKFDSTGSTLWAKHYGDSKHQYSSDMTVNTQGSPIWVGDFFGVLDFGSEVWTLMNPAADSDFIDSDSFIVKLQP